MADDKRTADEEKTAHVGYHPKKGAETFHLKRGEKLPEGYSAKPHPGQHPHDAEQGRGASEK
jgi:hypothetical protein